VPGWSPIRVSPNNAPDTADGPAFDACPEVGFAGIVPGCVGVAGLGFSPATCVCDGAIGAGLNFSRPTFAQPAATSATAKAGRHTARRACAIANR